MIYQVSFDTTIITVIADNEKELLEFLQEEDDDFILQEGKICYQWSDYMTDQPRLEVCFVEDVTNKRGIIQLESH